MTVTVRIPLWVLCLFGILLLGGLAFAFFYWKQQPSPPSQGQADVSALRNSLETQAIERLQLPALEDGTWLVELKEPLSEETKRQFQGEGMLPLENVGHSSRWMWQGKLPEAGLLRERLSKLGTLTGPPLATSGDTVLLTLKLSYTSP